MKKNILVTSTGGRSVGSGILHSLLRTSKDVSDRWNVIAADADPFAWGLYIASERELLPLAKNSNYFNRLRDIIKRHKIHAIIPGSEVEASLLSQNKDEFPEIFIVTNNKELMPLMMDKFFMHDKLASLGINFIPTFPITEWKKVVEKHGFPLIVKPTIGTGGSRGVVLIINEKELLDLLPNIGNSFCIQPYIGTEDDEYTVGVLTDKEGSLIDSIVMKRKLIGLSLLQSRSMENKTYTISSGYSQGYIIKDENIQKFCEKLATELKSTGPLNIQLRIANGQIHVFEIHPRFSGTTTIRADVGFNEVDLLLRNHIFNETFGRLHYKYNVAAIRAFEHVIVPMSEMPQ